MKISIIGAGNVGSLSAMRLAQEGLGEVILFDIVKGLAEGKAADMQDARFLLKQNYEISGTADINKTASSDIIVLTAGLPRRPGMTREDLINKNAEIVKGACLNIKKLSPQGILIVVTNPLDLMTFLALKVTGFNPKKVFGMGITLDASRFANLISAELKVPNTDIETYVMASHGEGMLPLPGSTTIKETPLNKFMDSEKIEQLCARTVNRGAEIVSLLGSGSAYFAPSAAILGLTRAIVKDEKRILGVSAYLNGEYGIKDICTGVPCRIGRGGIEKIVELELSKQDRDAFNASAEKIRSNLGILKPYGI